MALRLARIPSPLAGEGGEHRRCEPGEGSCFVAKKTPPRVPRVAGTPPLRKGEGGDGATRQADSISNNLALGRLQGRCARRLRLERLRGGVVVVPRQRRAVVEPVREQHL